MSGPIGTGEGRVPKTGRAELAYSLMKTGAWTKPSGPLARVYPAETAPPARPLPLDPEAFAVAGVPLAIDPAGALWWAAERLLVIADLHLEKGSAHAPRGMLLPPYDSAASLARLEALHVAHHHTGDAQAGLRAAGAGGVR